MLYKNLSALLLVFFSLSLMSVGLMAAEDGAPPVIDKHCDQKKARLVVDALLDRNIVLAQTRMSRWKEADPSNHWLPLYDALVLVAIADYSTSRDLARYDVPLRALEKVIKKSKASLKGAPKVVPLRLSLATGQAVAGRLMMEQGRWLGAFNHGYDSRQAMRALLTEYPGLEDVRLILGMFEYFTGAVPAAAKWLTYLVGFSGSEEKGIELLERVVEKAPIAAPQAAEALLVEVGHSAAKACRYLGLAATMRKTYPNNGRYRRAERSLQAQCQKAEASQRLPSKDFVLTQAVCPP